MTADGEADGPAQLADDLKTARWRGLADLDSRVGRGPSELPVLEPLARQYGANQTGSRVPLITTLLRDGLAAYSKDAEPSATFVRSLFFDTEGRAPGPSRAHGLLSAARKTSGLVSEDNFRKRQRNEFVDFAAFLIDFVERSRSVGEVADLSAESARARRRPRVWWSIGGGAVAVALAVVVAVAVRPGSTSAPPPHVPASTVTESTPAAIQLRFDSLGSTASSIINVYPGPLDTTRDRIPAGHYNSGDVVDALCQTTGRTVSSDPGFGEAARSTDRWIAVRSDSGNSQFATLTYAELLTSNDALPACDDVS